MKKLLIIFILLFYIVSQHGCFINYVEEIHRSKFPTHGNDENIFVLTIDTVLYEFKSNMYQFSSDSLIGTVIKDGKSDLIKLGYDEISNVGTKESKITTIGIISYSVIGFYIAFFVILALNAN